MIHDRVRATISKFSPQVFEKYFNRICVNGPSEQLRRQTTLLKLRGRNSDGREEIKKGRSSEKQQNINDVGLV